MSRFICGLLAATAVSILLFGFAARLVNGDDIVACVDCGDPPVLDRVRLGKPVEERIRKQIEPPEPPKEKPVTEVTSIDPTPSKIVPPRMPMEFSAVSGSGGLAIHTGWQQPASLGGNLVVTRMIEPQYPASALRAEIEGEVTLEFTVQADGRVTDIDVIDASPRGVFEQSARRAIANWGFQPRAENGRPVTSRVRQTLVFRLPK